MILPYPVDSPGYLSLPGINGNYASVDNYAGINITGDLTLIADVALADWTPTTTTPQLIAKWNPSTLSYKLYIQSAGVPVFQWSADGSATFAAVATGTGASDLGLLADGARQAVRVDFDVDNGASGRTVTFWRAPTTAGPWTQIGTPVISAVVTSIFAGTSKLFLGTDSAVANASPMSIYGASVRNGMSGTAVPGGTEVFRFDGSADLAGLPPAVAVPPPPPAVFVPSTFVPSVPTTSLVNVMTATSAVGQGYVTFPGTAGNYLSVADATSLDILGALTVVWRERARDITPTRLGRAIMSRATTAGQFSYRITHGPRDLIFGRSADGTVVNRSHVGSDQVPFNNPVVSRNEKWIWWCLTFDTVPTNATTRLWYSEDDSLTPPLAARWFPAGGGATATDALAKTIFNGSSPLFIGAATATDPSLDSDIGYLSLRTGGTNTVLGGTEVWRMDANNLVNLDLSLPTINIAASVGGQATVVKTATPKNTGYVEFPGTPGNFLEMPEALGDTFSDNFSLIAKVARDNWLPPDPEAIVAKWGDPGQCSYLWSINGGYLEFRWSVDGTLAYGVGSSITVPDPGVGVPLYIGMSTTRSGVTRTVTFWTSPDSVTWTPLGTTPPYAQPTATAIFNSNVPLTIGSAAAIKSRISNLHSFDGRILEVAGSTGVDGFFGGYTDTVETFRIGSENLQITTPPYPTAFTFPATGGTVTVRRNPYPDDFGVWHFPGTMYTRASAPTAGNYLQVPDAVNLRLTSTLFVEVRVAANDWTPPDTDRVLIGKMGASGNYGWQFLLTPRGTLKMVTSTNGTVLNVAESSVALPLQAGFAKRVGVSYVSTDSVKFWLSDDGITWTQHGVNIAASGLVFASTAPVQIGMGYGGALTNASIRSTVAADGSPLLGTEVFMMDQGCLNIIPPTNGGTFPATTGQTVTVFTADFSLHDATEGWINFPGTTGNYLDTPDVPVLDITGSMTIIIRMAPNDWTRTGKTQTILAKWSATAGNFSYLLQLLPSGIFRFTWSTDGTTTTSIDSGTVASYVDGEFRLFAFTFEWTTTVKTLRRWESLDFGDTWSLRDTATTAFGGTGGIFPGTALLTIGANNNTEHFEGRISYLDFRDGVGVGGAPAPVTATSRRLWWSAESLHIGIPAPPPAVATFIEETGKTITIRRANTPSVPGSLNFYGRVGDFANTTVPTLVDTTGMTVVTRLDLSETRPSTDRLAEGAASPTQTPRPNIVGDVFITAYLAIVAGSEDQVLCGAWWTQHETSWRLYLDRFTGGLRFNWCEDGINPTWSTPLDLATAAQLRALGTGLVFLGVQIERFVSGQSRFTAMTSTDLGATWIPFGTQRRGPQMNDTWPADPLKPDTDWRVRLSVGGEQIRDLTTATDDQTVTNASWLGEIQWVQMTQYPSDTLIWRFDPNEYPGTGVLYTDARTRDWRLDSETAIGQFGPLEAPDEQIVFQRWDEATKCCFSLRRIVGGFTFAFSQDGTPTTGGDVDIPIDAEEWHPGNQPGNWGWLAITTRVSGANSLVRIWIAPDAGTGTVPTTWTEIDTQVTATGVTALFVSTTEPFTIGAGKDGKLPFIGRISHLSLRDGTGTNGDVGGTERFRIDMNSLYGVLPAAGSFTAGTGQTVTMLPNTSARLADISPTPDGLPCTIQPSPPGPALYLTPAPVGPMTTVSPSTAGPTTAITLSPAAPTTAIVNPSLDRGWWPGQAPPFLEDPTKWWTQPAFTVQRKIPVARGDYVRGSANAAVEATALRFSTTSAMDGLSPEGLGKGILFATPHPDAPYDTVLIEWNLPSDLTTKGHTDTVNDVTLDPWLQVAIVRSAFGAPTTVNDGQTIFLATKSSLYPPVTNALGVVTHPYMLDDDNINILTEDVYDPRQPRSSDDDQVPKLPSGRWYYYSLFFMIGKTWYRAASDQVLLPRNHHHAEHLWNGLTPYYRWADEQQTSNDIGPLQKFLNVFGYDLDLTREYIESWQNMYQTDFTPMALLRRIGETFGIPYEATIGDIRYRALIAKLGFLYIGRGTSGTLRRYVSAASKCDCDVVTSPNIMLLPDDSDFFGGTGNWAGLHTGTTLTPGSGIPVPGARVPTDRIRLDYGTRNRPAVPEAAGRGSMHAWSSKADATLSFIITCGDGERYNYDTGAVGDTDRTNDKLISSQPDSLIPRFHGIYVKPDQVINFSFWACADPEAVNTVIQPMLIFFKKGGQPGDYISHDISNPPISLSLAIDTTTNLPKWYQVIDDAPVPANAAYCVPAIIVTGRPAGTDPTLSPMVHFAGAMVVNQGTVQTVSGTDPAVQMLTLDYAGEPIGGPQAGFTDSKLGPEP